MLVEPEHYKGIVYVRISALPIDQKIRIREGYNREAIVKILKPDSLIADCMLYADYLQWYKQYSPSKIINHKNEEFVKGELVLSNAIKI